MRPRVGERVDHPSHGVCTITTVSVTVGGNYAIYAKTRDGQVVFFPWQDRRRVVGGVR
jgi:hypothetical protein